EMGSWLRTATGGSPLRYRSRAGVSPEYHACRWLVGRFGQGSRKIVGIAGFPGSEAAKRQPAAGKMQKSAGKGQSSGVPGGSEGAQNMSRAGVREAGRLRTPWNWSARDPGAG